MVVTKPDNFLCLCHKCNFGVRDPIPHLHEKLADPVLNKRGSSRPSPGERAVKYGIYGLLTDEFVIGCFVRSCRISLQAEQEKLICPTTAWLLRQERLAARVRDGIGLPL